MVTASHNLERRARIAAAISRELDRQAHQNSSRIDVEAMAMAIDAVLDAPVPPTEGQHPQDLNATNDG